MDKCEFMNDEGKCTKYRYKHDCKPAIKDWFSDNCGIIDMSEVCKHTSPWGNTFSEITEEHLEALRNGKVLEIDDGEYCHFIALKGD